MTLENLNSLADSLCRHFLLIAAELGVEIHLSLVLTLSSTTMASLGRSAGASATSLRTALASGSRSYAVPSFAPSAASPFSVFDRNLKVAQRDRAARNKDRSRLTDYVKDDVAQTMVDRLLVSPFHSGEALLPRSRCTPVDQVHALPRIQDIKRRYPTVLDVGSGPGFLAKHVDPEITQKMILVDSSRKASTPLSQQGSTIVADYQLRPV